MSTTKKDPVVPTVVRELIHESLKIQGWREKLADNADDAYPEVLERVRNDYNGRLESIANDLVEHRSDLVSRLEDRKKAVETFRGDRSGHANDLEESRLRHAVGELSDEQWGSSRTTIEASLAEVDSVLETEEGAVEELTSVLDRVDLIVEVGSPPPPASLFVKKAGGRVTGPRPVVAAGTNGHSNGRVVAQDGSWSAVLCEVADAEEAAPEDEDTVDSTADAADEDELAFLESVSLDDVRRTDPIVVVLDDD